MRAIASSGEISRLMLAIKSALAAQDAVPLLVFDEIDANVGGEIAHAVGARIRELATRHQVLCITHLPPVAAAATSHFVVTKEIRGGRTFTQLREVSGKGRREEIARMLGGKSDEALKPCATNTRSIELAAGNDRGYRFEVLNYIWLALVLLAVALSAWTDRWKELTD